MPEQRTGPAPPEGLREGLLAVAQGDLAVHLIEAGDAPTAAGEAFAARFPARYLHVRGPGFAADVAERARDGNVVFAAAPVVELVEAHYPPLVANVFRARLRATVVGLPTGLGAGASVAARDDLQAFRGLPSTTVVAPADGPSVRAATVALAARDGSAYLRLPPPDAAPITDGAFAVGRAPELRPGSDLALLAYGPPLALALEAAEELARVGLSTRVLDLACLKPIDEGAILRAARDTGALLVLEEAPVSTGIGTLVAALTSENHPVPVRRLGQPDLWEASAERPGPGGPALTLDRVRDEAWELLRLRGRTT